MSKTEIWKDVVGHEGFYQVSNLGNVKSVQRISRQGHQLPEKMLVGNMNHKGYVRVSLTDMDGKIKKHSVHRLVLEAFVGPCPEGMEGCHRDGNSSNNALFNLRWGTPESNWEDRRAHGTASIGVAHPMATTSEDVVRKIKSRLKNGAVGKDLAKEFGVSVTVISQIKTGKTWSHIHE